MHSQRESAIPEDGDPGSSSQPFVTWTGKIVSPSPAPDIATERYTPSRRGPIAIRMTLWLGFGVVFGLAPVIVNTVKSWMSPAGLNLTDVLGHGELFITGAVVAGSAIGELVAGFVEQDFSAKTTAFKLFAILAGVGTVLLLLANTAGYMIEAAPATVRDTSIGFFAVTLLPAGAIVGMVAKS